MAGRLAKQLLYGTFFLAICIIVVGWIYVSYFKPQPTCFDGKQNQNEEAIDCGGLCPKICLYSGFTPLQVVGSGNIFFPDSSRIALVARVQNPNPEYATPSFSYTFTITDGQGRTVEIPGSSFIYAGEIKHIVALQPRQRTDIDFRDLRSVNLRLQEPQWVKEKDFRRPQLRIQEQRVSQDGSVRVDGVVTNEDTIDFRNVEVLALLFGTRGQLAGVSFTNLTSLPVNQQREFSIIHPPITDFDPQATQLNVSAYRPTTDPSI